MSLSGNKLGTSNGRASPFRRPESPSSPAQSPTKYQSTRPATPSKLQNSSTFNQDGTWSPSTQNLRTTATRDLPASPTRGANGPSTHVSSAAAPGTKQTYNTDGLAKLPPTQVREMREAFQILDRNSDGFVDRDDVADMLNQLGMDSSANGTATFFPAQTPHPLPMAAYLSSMSTSLAQMSPPSELLAALSAFDDDDSGQVDLNELTNALLGTVPEHGDDRNPLNRAEIAQAMQEFSGKRAFSKHSTGSSLSKGDVFRYREWVSSLQAVGGQDKAQAA